MKKVIIIRDRGQMTIPDSIRKIVDWASPMSAVSISAITPDKIIIEPAANKLDNNKIWASIKKARSIKGKGSSISATEFLIKDRKSH